MEYNIKEDRLDLDPEGNRKNSHKLTTVNIVFDGLQWTNGGWITAVPVTCQTCLYTPTATGTPPQCWLPDLNTHSSGWNTTVWNIHWGLHTMMSLVLSLALVAR